MDYEKLMQTARKFNISMDEIDRKFGNLLPHELSIQSAIATAMTAIEIGIKQSDWDSVAEGQAMLEQIIKRFDTNQQRKQR